MAAERSINSPCIRLCQLDRDEVCVGCFRTRIEIAGWLGMNAVEKRDAWARLDERRKRRTLEHMPRTE